MINRFESFEFKKGDRVRIKDGPFEQKVGRIVAILPEIGQVRVEVECFGRPTPIDMEWQDVELLDR